LPHHGAKVITSTQELCQDATHIGLFGIACVNDDYAITTHERHKSFDVLAYHAKKCSPYVIHITLEGFDLIVDLYPR